MTESLLSRIAPYFTYFALAFALVYILTPIVRELNRRLGMVDKPGARRINTVPVPRGGGLALALGVMTAIIGISLVRGGNPMCGTNCHEPEFWKLNLLSALMVALGLADDKFSLSPRLKLLGQLVIAALVWFWVGLGFHHIWPNIPASLDCFFTVFWIAGAVNAFNLIDGLDGLASGLAFIATIGMAGSLFLTGNAAASYSHFAFAGGLLAFLRYNYNPASIFLGDSGSMFIGFTLSVMPLTTQTSGSFLVSVGVPLLAMGVPIFDTALAIVRRSLRRLLMIRDSKEQKNGNVMTADADHIHHRILRATRMSQRKAAWMLYISGLFLVAVSLIAVLLKSRAAGLWVLAVAIASIAIFKDISRVELFDAGKLLSSIARDRARSSRRRIARLAAPAYIVFDIFALIFVFFLSLWALKLPVTRDVLRIELTLRVLSIFAMLYFTGAYRTVWARAMSSNFARLLAACALGSVLGTVATYYVPKLDHSEIKGMTLAYAMTSTVALVIVRLARGLIRDLFYALDCSRLKGRKDVSRILVYGSGLRYRAFRRELVRSATENNRIIVGIIDDDMLLRGQFIGGIQILGTLAQAPEAINALNVDAVVIACEVRPEWLAVILKTLEPTGVKITHFTFSEKEISSK